MIVLGIIRLTFVAEILPSLAVAGMLLLVAAMGGTK